MNGKNGDRWCVDASKSCQLQRTANAPGLQLNIEEWDERDTKRKPSVEVRSFSSSCPFMLKQGVLRAYRRGQRAV